MKSKASECHFFLDIINETHRMMGKIVFQATYRDDGEYVCSAVTEDTPVRSQTITRRLTILCK